MVFIDLVEAYDRVPRDILCNTPNSFQFNSAQKKHIRELGSEILAKCWRLSLIFGL